MAEAFDRSSADAWNREYARGRYGSEPPVAFVEDIISAARERDFDGRRGVDIGCEQRKEPLPAVVSRLGSRRPRRLRRRPRSARSSSAGESSRSRNRRGTEASIAGGRRRDPGIPARRDGGSSRPPADGRRARGARRDLVRSSERRRNGGLARARGDRARSERRFHRPLSGGSEGRPSDPLLLGAGAALGRSLGLHGDPSSASRRDPARTAGSRKLASMGSDLATVTVTEDRPGGVR